MPSLDWLLMLSNRGDSGEQGQDRYCVGSKRWIAHEQFGDL